MAGSVNKVILVGNLGRDPEVRSSQGGNRFANFSVATEESWKDKNTGERKKKTEWTNVVVYNDGLVGIFDKYLKKGSKVYVEGKLQTRKWKDNVGTERYSTEVVLQGFNGQIVLLDGGGQGRASSSGGRDEYDQRPAASGGGGQRERHPGADLDDEIPF